MSNSNRACASVLAVLISAAATPALSADLGRGPTVSPQPYEFREPAQFERWTGFYLGLTGGYGTGWTDVSGDSGAFDIDNSGGVGTLFGGYNWQFGNGLFGLEADIGMGNIGGSENSVSTDLNSIGSVRARLGYLVTPGFLAYGTAGFAFADLDLKANGNTQSETFVGYQVGGGTELKFSEPWSLRLEYMYTDLDSEPLDHNGIANTYEPDFHTVRAGMAYKF